MPRRRLIPVSLGGVGLSNIGRECWFDFEDGAMDTPEHEIIMLERTGAFPSRVRTQPKEKTLPLNIVLRSGDTEGQARKIGRIFDPVLGPQILIVRDFNEVERRMTVEARRIIAVADAPQDDRQWTVPLVAARPLWENEALTTFQDDIDSGTDPISFAALNAGNYDASPVFDATGRQLKYATQGYALLREVTYAWRGDLPATGPVTGTWLLELTDGGLATDDIVDVSAISTTSAFTILAATEMPVTITVTSTAGWDQEGILLAEPGTGSEEQFEYYVIDSTQLGLTARALGGTAAVLHTQPFTIHQSRMLKDGRDIAVFIDNVQVPADKVFLDSPDSASTQIWVEIADVPNASITPAAVVAFDDTQILLDNDRHGFAVNDYLVGEFTGGNEQLRVTAVEGRLITVLRGQRGTTQRAATAGSRIFKSRHRIQLAYNWSKAPARPDADSRITPLIDLNVSTNSNWHWLTGALASALTNSFATASTPATLKSGGWRPILYPGSDAVSTNRLAKKVSFANLSGPIRTEFKDEEPSSIAPNFDAVEFVSPCGIAGTNGIEYDASIGWPFALQVIVRDTLGLDHLLINRLGHEAGDSHEPPVVETNRQESPGTGSNIAAVILRARNLIVTGIQPADGTEETIGAALVAESDAQQFVLDASTAVIGMVVRVRESTSGVVLLQMQINEDGSPVGSAVTGIVDHSITASPTTLREVCLFYLFESPVLAAGTYFLVPFEDGAAGVLAIVKSTSSLYTRGAHYEGNPFVEVPIEDLWFAILSADADNQAEVTRRTDEVLTLDDVDVVFDTTVGFEKYPLIDLGPEENAYYYNTEWSQGAQDFRVNYLKRNEDVFRAAGLPVASGSYVGDASNPRNITGLGFLPELVIVFRDGGPAFIRGNADTWGTDSMEWDGSALIGTAITGLLADGFTVNSSLNAASTTYYWFAAGGPELIKTGSYTAPGGASGSVTGVGFAPDMVFGFNTSAVRGGAAKTQTMTGNDSKEMGAATVLVTDEITTLDADGFSFGNGGTMNRNGTDTVYWIAFARADYLQIFSYEGDGVDNRNLLAGEFAYAVVMGDTTQHSHHHPSSLAGDNSHRIQNTGAIGANIIQALNPNLQVGTDVSVNTAPAGDPLEATVYHVFAFAVPGGLPNHPADSDITVDVLAKTVVDNEFGDDIRATLLASSDDWVTIPPGNSPVAIEAESCSAEDEVGANEEAHSLMFRDTWSS